ncbi:MAG: hemolysin family protein [Candidatus Aquicultorales bacterium]
MSALATSVLVIFVLIVLNAFFAGSEIAVISVRETRVRPLAEKGSAAAKTILKFVEDPSRFLATIQIGVTLAGFFASATAASQVADDLARYLRSLGVPAANGIAVVLITLLISYITLVFGELVPKRLAIAKSEQIALFAAKPIEWISVIAYPFTRLLTFSTDVVVRLFGIRPEDMAPQATEDELKLLVAGHSALLEEEKEIIRQAFEFGDTLARQIMVPRPDIAAVEASATIREALETTKQSGHPRLLVYKEDMDDIIGAVHLKDLIQFIEKGQLEIEVTKTMRPVVYVPETRRAISLLRDLQKSGLHLAVVLDEYGGTAGIITVEDIAEEIVGEFGEKSEEEEMVKGVRDREIVIDGRMPITDVNERFDLQIPESPEYDTVAGWVLHVLRHIPRPGEEVYHKDILFRIQSVRQNRIALVRIVKPEEKKAE